MRMLQWEKHRIKWGGANTWTFFGKERMELGKKAEEGKVVDWALYVSMLICRGVLDCEDWADGVYARWVRQRGCC